MPCQERQQAFDTCLVSPQSTRQALLEDLSAKLAAREKRVDASGVP